MTHHRSAAFDGPVLVVGAGPTGLLLAAELRRRAVPVLLIDSRSEPLHWDRATVVHPRSLQIFEAIGVVDKLLEVGCKQRVITILSDGQVLGEIDLSTSGSVYGFNLGVSEEVTEAVLSDYLASQGGAVTHDSRLVGLTAHPDGMVADIEKDGERSQVHVRWVVGCDGIHSATRELTGIEFDGHKLAKQWAVFDAAVAGWTGTYEGNFAYQDAPPIILTALPGDRWRVYLRPTSDDSDLVADASATLRRYAPGASFVDVTNPARFNCYTKIAAQYRSGRVLLAGDSAHLCSPAEGHGMNTGLQDAFNLAWKLALVCHGAAHERLLDSYEAERRPIAETITQSGDVFEHAQMMTDPSERAARDHGIRAMLADPEEFRHQVMEETELVIDYSGSPIVTGGVGDELAAGFRLPDTIAVELSDTQSRFLHQLGHRAGHTLLLLAGQDASESDVAAVRSALQEFAMSASVFESLIVLATSPGIPAAAGTMAPEALARLGVREITLLALRPDGYIGLRSDRDHRAEVERYRDLIV